jgi:polyhydroxyalkanoate synthesis regulator phasin
MIPEMEKMLRIGIGAALLTKDAIEESMERMIQRSDISEAEARKLADELIKKGESQYEELEKAFRSAFRQGLESIDIARSETFQALQKRVGQLEKRMSRLEASQTPGTVISDQ